MIRLHIYLSGLDCYVENDPSHFSFFLTEWKDNFFQIQKTICILINYIVQVDKLEVYSRHTG